MKKAHKILFVILPVIIIIFLSLYLVLSVAQRRESVKEDSQTVKEEIPQEQIVGNDRDEHGCIGSAGYQWCSEKEKCLRIWEEECPSLIQETP